MSSLAGDKKRSSCDLGTTGSTTLDVMAAFSNMPLSVCSVRCEVASLRAAEESGEGKGQSESDSRRMRVGSRRICVQ